MPRLRVTDGASGTQTSRLDGTDGEDANPTGAVSEPDDSTAIPGRGDGAGQRSSDAAPPVTSGTADPASTGATPNATGTDSAPAGTSTHDADAGATGDRSVLYDEPGPFEGRSLEGTPGSDSPKELAQTARRRGGPGRGPPSGRPRSGRAREQVHPQELRWQARVRHLPGRGRRGGRDAPRVGAVQQEPAQSGRQHRGQRVGRRPQSHGGSTGGQRPLVRIRRDAPNVVDHLQRRPAPAPVPDRVRGNQVLEEEGEAHRPIPRRRSAEHHRSRPRRALRPQAPWLGVDTRDRIRPARAGVERVPVLAPRADRELAAEGRGPEPPIRSSRSSWVWRATAPPGASSPRPSTGPWWT